MANNVFCNEQKSVSDTYRNNWFKIFKGYPDMNDNVKKLLSDYKEADEYDSIFLFFNEICGYDTDYSMFLTTEMIKEG